MNKRTNEIITITVLIVICAFLSVGIVVKSSKNTRDAEKESIGQLTETEYSIKIAGELTPLVSAAETICSRSRKLLKDGVNAQEEVTYVSQVENDAQTVINELGSLNVREADQVENNQIIMKVTSFKKAITDYKKYLAENKSLSKTDNYIAAISAASAQLKEASGVTDNYNKVDK